MLSLIASLWPSSLFHFFYGATVALYLLILFTSKKKSTITGPLITKALNANPNPTTTKDSVLPPSTSKDQAPWKKIYMNIFFLDRKELIRNIIRSKVPKSRPVIRALAKRAAVALLENGIVERVASTLCQVVPERLSGMGVVCSANIVYSQAAYVCLEVNMHNLNLHKMLASSAGPEKATSIMTLLERFSLPAVNEMIARYMLNFISEKLISQLPVQMKEKMYNKMNAELEIIACTEEEQGPFMVQTIMHLDSSSKSPAPGDSSPTPSASSSSTPSA
jgi:hypothetical protein